MTDATARKIRMMEMALQMAGAEMGSDKRDKLQAEIDALKNGVALPITPVMASVKSAGRGRTRKAVVAAAPKPAFVPPAQINPGDLRPAANLPPVQTPPQTAPAAPESTNVTVEVSNQPVTFKRLYSGVWGISGPGLKTGETVTVLKRDGSTTDVVVGDLIGKPSKQGLVLARIDYSGGGR
jgi:hypothetical protein